MSCEYCGTEHPGPDVWHCGCRAESKRKLAALTKERDEARRERDCVGENEAFAHEEVEKLTKERDEARGENNMLRLQLAGKACYNCGGAINPQTMHCDECVAQDAALLARVAALEKALRSLLCACDNASLPHDVRGSCISPNMAMCMTDCRTALAGGKE